MRLGWKVVLGLAEPDLPGWDKVRSAQVAELVQLLPVICLTNIFYAGFLVSTLWDSVSRPALLGWAGALLLVLGFAVRMAIRAKRELSQASAKRGTVGRSVLHATALGLLWAVPSAIFSGTGTIGQQLAICLISAGVIGSATLTTATMPAAMFAFVAIAGAGLTVMMAKADAALLTALPPVYVLCSALGGGAIGRAFLVRKWAEASLADKTEVVSLLLREFEESSADWLWQVDSARRLQDVHPRLAAAAGCEAEALEGMALFRLLAGDAWETGQLPPPLKELLDRMNARESFSDLDLPVAIGGETRWWRLSAAPRLDEHGRFIGFRGVGSDVTEERRSVEKIDRLARFDALTGLANRVHFIEALKKSLAQAQRAHKRCALMLIDLDRFKAVNDTLGHPVGDKLLRAVAQRLVNLVREGDLCGRLGGDEFAMVIADAGESARIDDLGAAIVAALSRPFEVDGDLVHIGASVGTAIGPRDGRSVELLIRNADLALYRAKEDGRGVHRYFEPGLLARAEKRRAIEAALREAIADDQFRLVYQPVISTGDGRVTGFEALLRWTHPRLGEVSPADFVPIAEEARLLGTIGEWVLREACGTAAGWPHPTRLYVNLAAEQLHDPDFPAILQSALDGASLLPARLELELPEALFLSDAAAALAAIERIRALGVRIALDNFGTGHSALGHIRQGRFSTIKMDRALVHAAAARSTESVAIIRAAVAMADTLGLATIAAGVETRAEQALVSELGCRHVQGYAVHAPMETRDANALVAAKAQGQPA